eukprot:gene17560-19312_t
MAENEEKPSSEPTQLEKKIIRQIEYTIAKFSLTKPIGVSLDCLITFNRLKALSTDFTVIMNALKKSDAGLLEQLNEEKNCIRRSTNKPVCERLDPQMLKSAHEKTIYMKGFPTDYTLDNIEEFFEGKGKIVFIKMRKKEEDKSFKGSIFVEFETAEMAQQLLNMEELKCGETVLEKMKRDDFYKKQDDEKKNKKSGETKDELVYPKGGVLHFVGVGDETSREDLRKVFGDHEEVTWIDFERNDKEGKVRFKNEGGAQRGIDGVMKANDGKIIINGVESTVRVLEGEEEEKFWKQAVIDDKEREKAFLRRRHGGKGRKGGRGGRGDWGKRSKQEHNGNKATEKSEPEEKPDHKRFEDDDGPQAKQAKEELEKERIKAMKLNESKEKIEVIPTLETLLQDANLRLKRSEYQNALALYDKFLCLYFGNCILKLEYDVSVAKLQFARPCG